MVYSFLAVNATLAGPGGFINLGAGAAAAAEGITVESVADKNVMTIGADGRGQHSLVGDDSRTVTIRLLKTAPANALLMLMYNLQTANPALWGQNVLTIVDSARGDTSLLQAGAFKKAPTITYAQEGGMNEWTFDFIQGNTILGSGN